MLLVINCVWLVVVMIAPSRYVVWCMFRFFRTDYTFSVARFGLVRRHDVPLLLWVIKPQLVVWPWERTKSYLGVTTVPLRSGILVTN